MVGGVEVTVSTLILSTGSGTMLPESDDPCDDWGNYPDLSEKLKGKEKC